MPDHQYNQNDYVTERECDLRHTPIEAFMRDLNRRHLQYTAAWLSGLVLLVATLVAIILK